MSSVFFLKLLYVLKSSRMGELGGVPIQIARSFSLYSVHSTKLTIVNYPENSNHESL